jgi:N-acetylglucosamine-6-phosphate deacetylase
VAKYLVIENGRAILPDRIIDATLICRDGLIDAVQSPKKALPKDSEIFDARGSYIAPGFVDLHVHGGGGSDFMDGTIEDVRIACRSHLKHGTTTLFPTTSTASTEAILTMIAACKQHRDQYEPEAGAKIAGIHLYGPYFAANKSGCHDPEHCRPPTRTEAKRYFDTDFIRIATCAAELPGARQFYRFATKHDCLITCGHSNASWTEMDTAFKVGMRHVDHFWCAMSSVSSVRERCGTPMQGSMLEYVLGNPEISTEVIADGHHLAPELLRFAAQMKGPQRLCLVTDGSRALDQPPGEYRFGSRADGPVFNSDGRVGRVGDGRLASSVMGMDHMVRVMFRDSGMRLPDVIRMASLTPAERAGIADEVGSLEAGKAADLVLLNAKLKVQRVWVNGVAVQMQGLRRHSAEKD